MTGLTDNILISSNTKMPVSKSALSLDGSIRKLGFVLVVLIIIFVMSNRTQPKEVPVNSEPETETETETETKTEEEKLRNYKLVVTEDGVFKGLERMKHREGYIIAPDLYRCYEDDKPEYCSGHAPKSGWAYMYDIRLGPTLLRGGSKYTQCPDGGHACWYVEKYVDGTLTMIRNKQGIELSQKMADDLWTNQWNIEDAYIRDTVKSNYKLVESKEGNNIRLDIYKVIKQRGQFIDVKMTPANASAGVYLTYLLLLIRLSGEDKPKKVQLDIKGLRLPHEGRP